MARRVRFAVRVRAAALALLMALVAGAFTLAPPATAAGPIHGIDVSAWQGQVDWLTVQRSGRLFGFAKATEGATFVDRTFATNRAAMGQAGLVLRGFYHFARPDRNTAAAEAAHFLRTVGPLGPGEVAVLDLEVHSGLPGIGDWAAEWLRDPHQPADAVPALGGGMGRRQRPHSSHPAEDRPVEPLDVLAVHLQGARPGRFHPGRRQRLQRHAGRAGRPRRHRASAAR